MTIVARASINAGAPQQGGLTVAAGDTVDLSLASYVGVGSILWELYSYPEGFTEPTGWETATDRYYWAGAANSGLIPPQIDLTGAPWGKYLVRSTANYDANERDEALAFQILGPGGIEDVAPLETNQFEATRLRDAALQRFMRAVGAVAAPGTSPGDPFVWTGAGYASRSREHVNVRDYGAVGNGVTDDTSAIAAAGASAATDSLPLRFPPGTYALASDVEIACRVDLDPGATLAPAAGKGFTSANRVVLNAVSIAAGAGTVTLATCAPVVATGRISAVAAMYGAGATYALDAWRQTGEYAVAAGVASLRETRTVESDANTGAVYALAIRWGVSAGSPVLICDSVAQNMTVSGSARLVHV